VGLTVVAAVGGSAGADASGQTYAVPCPAADQVTPALNTNLIANPGAEDVTSLTTLGAPSNDTVNVANNATQLISLGSLKAAGQPFELSGYLGGYQTKSDNLGVTATFEDVNRAILGSAQIGPVTAAQRGSVTKLLHQAWYGTVPVGTARILITLNQTGSGVTLDGSADGLNLTIGSSAVPSSPVLQKLPYTATGTDGGLRLPAGVSAANGTVYASNTSEGVLAVLKSGDTSAIAGSLEGYGEHGDGLNAGSATLYQPAGTAEDAKGDVFIADSGDNVVREITQDGVIHRFAGTGFPGALLSHKATSGQLDHPDAVAVDAKGNLYIADSANNVIRRVDARTGIITTVAGDYAADKANDGLGGFSGDGGPATKAQLNDPQGVAVDGAGDLFIADTFNSAIREVTPAGVISTVVGVVGANGAAPTPGSESSGAAPTASHLSGPQAVAVDLSTATLYIADTHNSAIAAVSGVAQPGSAAGPVAPTAKS
jgi:hypothetical protein